MAEQVVIPTNGGFAPASRDTVHAQGAPHFCVHLLVTSQDMVYLQRRSRTRPRNPNRWTSTFSGHITVADATDHQQLLINQHAGLVALAHELREELLQTLDVHRDARYLGNVVAVSVGGGETCNCTSLVFTLHGTLHDVETEEVAELRAFPITAVTDALRTGELLPGNGGKYGFADNFASVFHHFAQARNAKREPA